MGVDADRDRLAGERGNDIGGRLRDLVREAGAVRVAEADVLRPGRDCGLEAGEGVAAIVAPGVEEMLGVVDDALAGAGAVGDRVGDHRQVLVAGDLRDDIEVKGPGLADQRDDRREAADQGGEPRVLGGLAVAAPGHPERSDRRMLERDVCEQLEQLEVLRVRVREPGLDQVDSEAIERLDDADLLRRRQRHSLTLHAVAQSRVV